LKLELRLQRTVAERLEAIRNNLNLSKLIKRGFGDMRDKRERVRE
jgi:hypothetical protein